MPVPYVHCYIVKCHTLTRTARGKGQVRVVTMVGTRNHVKLSLVVLTRTGCVRVDEDAAIVVVVQTVSFRRFFLQQISIRFEPMR
jgi:hypothetical protein